MAESIIFGEGKGIILYKGSIPSYLSDGADLKLICRAKIVVDEKTNDVLSAYKRKLAKKADEYGADIATEVEYNDGIGFVNFYKLKEEVEK